MLAGNVVALLSPFVFIPILTYAFGPDDYDYQSMRDIRRADDHDVAQEAHVDLRLVPGENHDDAAEAAEQAQLNRAAWISRLITVFMTVCLLVLWPMPMYGSAYIFSKKFFTGWVTVGILWLFFSAYVCPCFFFSLFFSFFFLPALANVLLHLQGVRRAVSAVGGPTLDGPHHQKHLLGSDGTWQAHAWHHCQRRQCVEWGGEDRSQGLRGFYVFLSSPLFL